MLKLQFELKRKETNLYETGIQIKTVPAFALSHFKNVYVVWQETWYLHSLSPKYAISNLWNDHSWNFLSPSRQGCFSCEWEILTLYIFSLIDDSLSQNVIKIRKRIIMSYCELTFMSERSNSLPEDLGKQTQVQPCSCTSALNSQMFK